MTLKKLRKGMSRFGACLLALCLTVSMLSSLVLRADAIQVPDTDADRIYGATRYETSFAVADTFLENLGTEKLPAVIVASGLDFADALAGSYLAVVKNAPILLFKGNQTAAIQNYIRQNLISGGTVYILGGEKAVSVSFEAGLSGFQVKRLAGATRFETNLEILKEAGVSGGEILACTGYEFADSLSASAVGKPILLVNTRKGQLTDVQKAFLSESKIEKLYVLGGTAAVSTKLEGQLKAYGTVERIGGNTRYETSVLVAEKFFSAPEAAVLTYAMTYPDGLCGGLLANQLGAPMILTRNQNAKTARAYTEKMEVSSGVVLGGDGLISDDTVRYIFGTAQTPDEPNIPENTEPTEPEAPASYKITYVLDGGENSARNPSTYTQGETVTLQAPSKDKYSFQGWYLDAGFTKEIGVITGAQTGNLTLYAKWEAARYAISYVLDGGTNASSNPAAYTYGDTVVLADPTKDHAVFGGWYLDAGFTKPVETIAPTEYGDMTFYAKWTPQAYSIYYVLNGGTNADANPDTYAYGSTVTLKDPERGETVFLGWYMEDTFETRIESISATQAGDITLYAKWQVETYTITYVLDGGRNSARNPDTYTEGETVTLQGASKSYNTFDGWYLEPAFQRKITAITPDMFGDLTLYAKWEPFTYTITYELNKGVNNENNPETYIYGPAIKLEEPTRANHTFDGWYLEKTFKTRVYEIPANSTGNISLYAKWHLSQLNINGEGMDNMIWSWWYHPQVVSTEDAVYWGYATNEGYSGVAAYDIDTGKVTYNHLKRLDKVDDHNGLAVTTLKDGRIMCLYAGGHDSNNEIHVRISEKPNSIEKFSTDIVLTSAGKTCYGQVIQYDGRIYVFYRMNSKSWAYRSTEDGINWTDEVVLVKSTMQYYCKVVPTTQEGLVRVCMTSNPTADDPRIRMGFLDLDTGKMYRADGTTEAVKNQNSSYDYDQFEVLLAPPSGKIQRLFDVAVTDPADVKILYTVFSNSKTANDSEYYLYDSGKSVKICDGGVPLWNPKYQGGAAFAGTDQIVAARNAGGKDYVEVYKISGDKVTLQQSVYSEATGTGTKSVRNARPIVDVNGKFFLWHRGYYNPNSYTDFDTDAMIATLP